MEQNIIYDIDELKQRLDQNLDELSHIRMNEKYAALLGEAFVSKVAKWESSIRRQKDMPFTMVVCGAFKRGKSSLINAFLGEDVVTTDVTTETITLNRISYGEHSNALVLDGGKRLVLSDDQLCRSALEKILKNYEGKVFQLELKRPIEVLRRVTIIDTPGLDDSLQDFGPMVSEALMQADAVIYVFSVNYPLARQEQMFLKTSILPQKHTEIFLVGNYVDMLSNEQQYDRMKAELESRVRPLLPTQPIYMLSALDERCRQLGEERPCQILQNRLETSFAEFCEHVNRILEEKCDMVLPDRMERMFRGMKEDLEQLLSTLERGTLLDRQALDKEKEKARDMEEAIVRKQGETVKDFTDKLKIMTAQTEFWIRGLVANMRQETASLENYDLDDIRRYYALYCIDTLQEAMRTCVDYHMDQLYDQLDGISAEIAQKFSSTLESAEVQDFRFVLHNKTWTKGDNVSFVLDQVGLGNSIVGYLAKGFAGSMRQTEMQTNAQAVYLDIQQQYDQLEQAIPGTVSRVYTQITDRVLKQIQEYFIDREVQIQTQTEQIVQVASRGVEEKEQIRQTILSVRAILDGFVD